MTFLNEKRLHDYPRLFFFTIWSVFLINIIFHRGWVGRFGGIIGVDFVCIYSGGLLYRTAIDDLYNLQAQAVIQQELFQPTPLAGTVNIFTHPPYAAYAYSLLTFIPLGWAFFLWNFLSLCGSVGALFLIHQYVFPSELKDKLSLFQLTILVFSSIPFVLGIFFGQSHSLTFLLLTGIIILMLDDRWFLAGILAGMLIYKPHFIIGFLILWVVWKKYKSILGFALFAIPWSILVLIQHGFKPYLDYLGIISLAPTFSIVDGISWETTLSALFQNMVRVESGTLSLFILISLLVLASAGLGIYSYKNQSTEGKIIALMAALLLPYLVSPHILIYDLMPVILILALWSKISDSRKLRKLVIFIFLSTLLLPALTKFLGLPLLAIIPLVILMLLISDIHKRKSHSMEEVME